MGKSLHLDQAAEKEATDIGAKFMHSSDVVGDMSRAYGRDLSSVRIHTDESAARGAAERGVDAFSTGKDVFFARGAFDRSDPASRGLLAHELSHSMQQGVGGEGGAVAQSAPMGAAQGGILSWFKGMFSKSGDAEEPAPEQEASETDAQLTQSNDPQKELNDVAETLRSSKKWGLFGNSDKFENVSTAINVSVGKLNATLSGDLAQDHNILEEITDSFRKLIDACDDYITSHDPSTDRGKHRQAIVRQVRELAAKDRACFAIYMSSPDQGERVTSPIDILKKSRQRTLQLVDKTEEDLEHVGGAASYIAKIEPGMLTDANASGFFKEDEIYTKSSNDDKTFKLKALDVVRKKMSMSDAQYTAMKTSIEQKGVLSGVPGYYQDRTIHDACQMVIHMESANKAVQSNLSHHMENGESLNLSKRNVATSRLAELLDLGDLVAKSETATLVDADGTSRSGNLMQAAKGQEVAGFVVEHFRDQYAADYKRAMAANEAVPNKTGNMDDKVTPEFMQSLMSLQVLDNLAAQSDRHAGNYFAQIKDGKLGRVQGIDNDFSFSDDTLEYDSSGFNNIGNHGRNILDKNGELAVPYMDRALADRITALNEQVLRDVMADILEPWAIDALCIRFQKIKGAIERDQEKNPGSGRYLERDEDWGKKEVFDTLRSAATQNKKGYKLASNYVANFLKSADMDDQDYSGTLKFREGIDTDFRKQIARGVLQEAQNLGDAGQAKEYLAAHGVEPRILDYLEATGQLLDGPALLKSMPDGELSSRIAAFVINSWRDKKK